jgi:hypothetical protein
LSEAELSSTGPGRISGPAAAHQRQEADFVRDGIWMRVLGDIDLGFADRFSTALDPTLGSRRLFWEATAAAFETR